MQTSQDEVNQNKQKINIFDQQDSRNTPFVQPVLKNCARVVAKGLKQIVEEKFAVVKYRGRLKRIYARDEE